MKSKDLVDKIPWKYSNVSPFQRQPHKLVNDTQTIRRFLPRNCLSVFEYFVRFVLKGLKLKILLPFCTKDMQQLI